MAGSSRRPPSGSWSGELSDLVRAGSGGLLFGVPLLYTIELTWIGRHTTPLQALVVIAACMALLTVLNRTGGFRSRADQTFRDATMDAVEGVALALVLVVAVQLLLGEIDGSTPVPVVFGMAVYDALAVCVGIGIATHLLGGDDNGDRNGSDAGGEGRRERGRGSRTSSPLNATAADLGASAIGAVFVSISIAPTDEVRQISASRSPAQLLMIIAASLVVAYAIVFVAGFAGQVDRRRAPGIVQHPVVETLASYVVALVTSAAMLWLFQRDASSHVMLTHVIVLGFPAAIGGAAGRLAV